MNIEEHKCPNCGGAVKFDSSSQKMKCPYCDTEFEIAALEEYQKEVAIPAEDNFGWAKEAGETWGAEELDDLSSSSCPSCGAELMGDKNTVAMVCLYCGNAQVVNKRLSDSLKPDCIIPFKLDKKAAVDALGKFCKGKRLLPDFFNESEHINDIQGVYVPFWLFDAKADGHIRYKATKVKSWFDSSYNYTKTDYYSVLRNGTLAFEKIPVDGSEKMDDSYMDAIEPFDYKQIKDFQTSFLAGYVAEKYDVGVEESKERAAKRIKSSVQSEFARSVSGYSSVMLESSSVEVKDGKASYALFPVWVLNTKYKEENYLFIMNGESGRLVGSLPVDSGKAWKYRFLFTGIFGAIFTAILMAKEYLENSYNFFGQDNMTLVAIAWVLSLVIGFLIVWNWKSKMNTVALQTQANAYIIPGSLNINEKKDTFLYSTVTKIRRQTPQSSGGARGRGKRF